MQVGSKARGFVRVLTAQTFLNFGRSIALDVPALEASSYSSRQQWQHHSAFSSLSFPFSGIIRQRTEQHSVCSILTARASFSSEAVSPTEIVKELYDKMLKSVDAGTMPPNVWLWSAIKNCENHEDIKLLFDILLNLRKFRLSNLRIHENFNCHLCQEVARACARAGALNFGKMTLWKHNVYGLTPSITSAHHLLFYAKKHNDVDLMVEVMKLMKNNGLPYQPGAADIVFSICYNSDNWQLISTYSKKFLDAGVKLRRTTFDTWMEFAAKRGDTQSLWKIEKLRSEMVNWLTIRSGLSCAKGFLLERKPDDAAAITQLLIQKFPESKRADIVVELQKLISEWPLEVVEHQKEEDRKALADSLKTDILLMVGGLQNMGFELSVNLEETSKEATLA